MVEWPGHSWRGLFADSVQPAPHNVLRPRRRWRRLPSRLTVNKPILRSVPTTGWDKFAGISQWMHPMGQVLMTAIRYCGNPMESEVVAQRGGIVQQEPSRDTWTEIQAQHCCSLTCLSHPSASDDHSKRHFASSCWNEPFSWKGLSFRSLRSFLFACFLSLCCNFSPNGDGLLWHETSLQVLVNSAVGVIITGIAFKSKFPVQYNYSCLNKGCQQCYPAAPLYINPELFLQSTACFLLLSENDSVRIKH